MHHFKNASSQLDPLPTYLLKECADVLTPITTTLINSSLQEGRVPARWKVGLVIPLTGETRPRTDLQELKACGQPSIHREKYRESGYWSVT